MALLTVCLHHVGSVGFVTLQTIGHLAMDGMTGGTIEVGMLALMFR